MCCVSHNRISAFAIVPIQYSLSKFFEPGYTRVSVGPLSGFCVQAIEYLPEVEALEFFEFGFRYSPSRIHLMVYSLQSILVTPVPRPHVFFWNCHLIAASSSLFWKRILARYQKRCTCSMTSPFTMNSCRRASAKEIDSCIWLAICHAHILVLICEGNMGPLCTCQRWHVGYFSSEGIRIFSLGYVLICPSA